jgi:hypothetical protein
VQTNADSRLQRLPPFLAQMIAAFNSGRTPEGGTPGQPPANGPGGAPPAGTTPAARAEAGGPRGGPGGRPRDFQQMLERTPKFSLTDLKPGEAVIVVSTEGAKPSEVTAIALLAGVEPILSAQPKGNEQMELGPWNMSMGGEGGP